MWAQCVPEDVECVDEAEETGDRRQETITGPGYTCPPDTRQHVPWTHRPPAGPCVCAGREAAVSNFTFALDTSSRFPRSCSHICREVLLPCGCPVWSSSPMMVNVTLKTCSTRGLAHFSSSSFSSGTVNSSTVGPSCCCCLPAAGSLAPGCSAHASSVTRRIPRRGRVVDIPPLGRTVAPDRDDSVLGPAGDAGSLRRFHGVFNVKCGATRRRFNGVYRHERGCSASFVTRKPRVTYPESPRDDVIKTRRRVHRCLSACSFHSFFQMRFPAPPDYYDDYDDYLYYYYDYFKIGTE